MNKPSDTLFPGNPQELLDAVNLAADQSSALLQQFLAGQEPGALQKLDPLGLLPSFAEFGRHLMERPTRLVEAQLRAWESYARIWQSASRRMLGLSEEPAEPTASDKRFKSDAWHENPFFDYVRQTYLATAQVLQSIAADNDGIDEHTSRKIAFYTNQFIDALAPTNFLMTNPEVLRATVDSGGRNLVEGMKNFIADIDPKSGRLRTRMVDSDAFELGENVAVTPGKVVFENALMQLLQYSPATEKVFQRPLLIIPPWINKFYILDLQPKNSFIKWAVDQGHTVFVISWVNPDASLADKDFEDYLREGPLAALDAVAAATGEESVNVIGYCLGGTLLAALLGLMEARGDKRINSATFFTSMLDFSEPGDLGVFIDEQQVAGIESAMQERGYLDGAEMATTFNMLRANDLIWSFVVNNYMLGRQPMAFDLLFWNADSTRMPARMHSTYLRKMYLENAFCQPGGMSVDGTPVDLSSIKVPACFVSAVEDHIAPWKSTYTGAQLFAGPVKFILGKAGHVAGIINPPGPKQYGHFSGPDVSTTVDADTWLAGATLREDSWWVEWGDWIAAQAGKRVSPRTPGSGPLPALEDAPGRYVKQR